MARLKEKPSRCACFPTGAPGRLRERQEQYRHSLSRSDAPALLESVARNDLLTSDVQRESLLDRQAKCPCSIMGLPKIGRSSLTRSASEGETALARVFVLASSVS